MCLNDWSTLGFVRDSDVQAVTMEDASKDPDAVEDVQEIWGDGP